MAECIRPKPLAPAWRDEDPCHRQLESCRRPELFAAVAYSCDPKTIHSVLLLQNSDIIYGPPIPTQYPTNLKIPASFSTSLGAKPLRLISGGGKNVPDLILTELKWIIKSISKTLKNIHNLVLVIIYTVNNVNY